MSSLDSTINDKCASKLISRPTSAVNKKSKANNKKRPRDPNQILKEVSITAAKFQAAAVVNGKQQIKTKKGKLKKSKRLQTLTPVLDEGPDITHCQGVGTVLKNCDEQLLYSQTPIPSDIKLIKSDDPLPEYLSCSVPLLLHGERDCPITETPRDTRTTHHLPSRENRSSYNQESPQLITPKKEDTEVHIQIPYGTSSNEELDDIPDDFSDSSEELSSPEHQLCNSPDQEDHQTISVLRVTSNGIEVETSFSSDNGQLKSAYVNTSFEPQSNKSKSVRFAEEDKEQSNLGSRDLKDQSCSERPSSILRNGSVIQILPVNHTPPSIPCRQQPFTMTKPPTGKPPLSTTVLKPSTRANTAKRKVIIGASIFDEANPSQPINSIKTKTFTMKEQSDNTDNNAQSISLSRRPRSAAARLQNPNLPDPSSINNSNLFTEVNRISRSYYRPSSSLLTNSKHTRSDTLSHKSHSQSNTTNVSRQAYKFPRRPLIRPVSAQLYRDSVPTKLDCFPNQIESVIQPNLAQEVGLPRDIFHVRKVRLNTRPPSPSVSRLRNKMDQGVWPDSFEDLGEEIDDVLHRLSMYSPTSSSPRSSRDSERSGSDTRIESCFSNKLSVSLETSVLFSMRDVIRMAAEFEERYEAGRGKLKIVGVENFRKEDLVTEDLEVDAPTEETQTAVSFNGDYAINDSKSMKKEVFKSEHQNLEIKAHGFNKSTQDSLEVFSKPSILPFCFAITGQPPAGKSFYFAYGSDMNHNRLSAVVSRSIERPVWGLLYGFELIFTKLSSNSATGNILFPNLILNQLTSTEGGIYLLDEADIRKLDSSFQYPEQYYRGVFPIWMGNEVEKEEDDLILARNCIPAVVYICKQVFDEDFQQSDDYNIRQCIIAAEGIVSDEYCSFLRRKLLRHSRENVA